MRFRTPLSHVRGLGSAREGTHHWWLERTTSAALIPLTLWFIISLVFISRYDHAELAAWIARPFNTALLVLFLTLTFHHSILGIQVVIEDYVHHEGYRLAALVATKFLLVLCGVIGVIAVLRIAFGG
jgi:succinate dehydrogenase / fumarate reductase, membrane anchor subunit